MPDSTKGNEANMAWTNTYCHQVFWHHLDATLVQNKTKHVSVIHFPLYFVKYNHKINPEYHPSPNPIPQTNNLFFFWVKSSQVSGLCISPVELSESLY